MWHAIDDLSWLLSVIQYNGLRPTLLWDRVNVDVIKLNATKAINNIYDKDLSLLVCRTKSINKS